MVLKDWEVLIDAADLPQAAPPPSSPWGRIVRSAANTRVIRRLRSRPFPPYARDPQDTRYARRQTGAGYARRRQASSAVRPGRHAAFWHLFLVPAMLLYAEAVTRAHFFGTLTGDGFWTMLGMNLFLGFVLGTPLLLLGGRARRALLRITAGAGCVLYSFFSVYYRYFRMVFSWRMMGQAGDAMQFWKDILVTVASIWYLLLLFLLPFVLLCVFGRRLCADDIQPDLRLAAVGVLLALLPYAVIMAAFHRENQRQITDGAAWCYTNIPTGLERPVQLFGLLNSSRLEWQQLLFGTPDEEIDGRFQDPQSLLSRSDAVPSDAETDAPEPKVYPLQRLDIDFDAASARTNSDMLHKMNSYYAAAAPTRQNAYTGLFRGKNLIFLTLEGFSSRLIDPELTPILYKMSTEGFVFDSFYTSSWTGSTASGEYANLTGNAYATADCLKKLAKTSQPYALGHQFNALGYRTLAYHNNTYTYYGRNLSHPSLGYEYMGIGHGLKLPFNGWPRSDKEMAEATADQYIGTGQPFHAYYMTVSGHTRYSTLGNAMSSRHYHDLPEKYKSYPQEVKAYLACQYEVELMLEVLVERLEQAGELENTVFAMAADHYPYGMEDDSLAWFYGLPKSGIRRNWQLYRNGFILWCASMKEPVVVSQPAGNVDILPTLLNLFGIPYDSRVMMGKDILSEGDHYAVVVINGRNSWISSQGVYDCCTDKFTPRDDCTLSDDEREAYVKAMNKHIRTEIYYSHQILNFDYYGYLFGDSAP